MLYEINTTTPSYYYYETTTFDWNAHGELRTSKLTLLKLTHVRSHEKLCVDT